MQSGDFFGSDCVGCGRDMGIWCRCQCHHGTMGDLREAVHKGDDKAVEYFATEDHLSLPPMVSVTLQLEAWLASGCGCSQYHCALYPPKPRYLPPRNWTPDVETD